MYIFRNLTMMLMLATASLSSAQTVHGFIPQSRITSTPKEYLSPSPMNMGYITIKASFENPESKGCISPSGSGMIRKLYKESSELFLAARVWGFKGVTSENWIPLASYQWNNEGQYCNSSFRPDALIVPLTPILASLDVTKPGLMEEPYIRISLRSKSERTEKLSTAFSTLLEVSSAYATGGAASTLSQLLNFTGNPAAKILIEEVNSYFKVEAQEDFPINFKWNDLATAGMLEFPFKISSIEKRFLGLSKRPKKNSDRTLRRRQS